MKPVDLHVSKYEMYLQSERFDEIRQAVFDRDGHKCVVCGSTENLRPHHLTYRNVYNENLDDLVTLCNRCHSIYHNVENRKKYIDEIYEGDDWRKTVEENQREAEREEEVAGLIYKEITEEYLREDYCKDGDMDMMSWDVLNPVIKTKCEKYGVKHYGGNKNELRNYFLYRRCEFLVRCMDKGFSANETISRTKFDPTWLYKWYSRKRCESKLQEEQRLKELKGEQKNETN